MPSVKLSTRSHSLLTSTCLRTSLLHDHMPDDLSDANLLIVLVCSFSLSNDQVYKLQSNWALACSALQCVLTHRCYALCVCGVALKCESHVICNTPRSDAKLPGVPKQR